MKKLLILSAALFAAFSCAEQSETVAPEATGKTMTITVGMGDATKVNVDSNWITTWVEGDQLMLIPVDAVADTDFSTFDLLTLESGANSKIATFSGDTTIEGEYRIFHFPQDNNPKDSHELREDGVVRIYNNAQYGNLECTTLMSTESFNTADGDPSYVSMTNLTSAVELKLSFTGIQKSNMMVSMLNNTAAMKYTAVTLSDGALAYSAQTLGQLIYPSKAYITEDGLSIKYNLYNETITAETGYTLTLTITDNLGVTLGTETVTVYPEADITLGIGTYNTINMTVDVSAYEETERDEEYIVGDLIDINGLNVTTGASTGTPVGMIVAVDDGTYSDYYTSDNAAIVLSFELGESIQWSNASTLTEIYEIGLGANCNPFQAYTCYESMIGALGSISEEIYPAWSWCLNFGDGKGSWTLPSRNDWTKLIGPAMYSSGNTGVCDLFDAAVDIYGGTYYMCNEDGSENSTARMWTANMSSSGSDSADTIRQGRLTSTSTSAVSPVNYSYVRAVKYIFW